MQRMAFIPGNGVGDIKFGISEHDLPKIYEFVFDAYISEKPLDTRVYVSERFGIRVSFEADRLVAIACSKSIFFEGVELVGAVFKNLDHELSSFEKIDDPEEILMGDGPQHIIYIDELGLSFWIDKSDKVKSVDCVAPCA